MDENDKNRNPEGCDFFILRIQRVLREPNLLIEYSNEVFFVKLLLFNLLNIIFRSEKRGIY